MTTCTVEEHAFAKSRDLSSSRGSVLTESILDKSTSSESFARAHAVCLPAERGSLASKGGGDTLAAVGIVPGLFDTPG